MALTPWGKRHEKIARAEAILGECCHALDLPVKSFAKSAKEWIGRRSWEDDPAEMRRLIYTAALVSHGDKVEAAHFPPRTTRDHKAFSEAHFENLSLEEAVAEKMAHFFKRLGDHEVSGLHETVVEYVERPLIRLALEWSRGNHLKASRLLGLHRNTLRKKIRELGIEKG